LSAKYFLKIFSKLLKTSLLFFIQCKQGDYFIALNQPFVALNEAFIGGGNVLD